MLGTRSPEIQGFTFHVEIIAQNGTLFAKKSKESCMLGERPNMHPEILGFLGFLARPT